MKWSRGNPNSNSNSNNNNANARNNAAKKANLNKRYQNLPFELQNKIRSNVPKYTYMNFPNSVDNVRLQNKSKVEVVPQSRVKLQIKLLQHSNTPVVKMNFNEHDVFAFVGVEGKVILQFYRTDKTTNNNSGRDYAQAQFKHKLSSTVLNNPAALSVALVKHILDDSVLQSTDWPKNGSTFTSSHNAYNYRQMLR
jgi:hypothetical protein